MTATQQDATPPEPLLLPEVEEMPLDETDRPRLGGSASYGALEVAAAYCGLKQVPDHLRGDWQHGWSASYRLPLPPGLILGNWAEPQGYSTASSTASPGGWRRCPVSSPPPPNCSAAPSRCGWLHGVRRPRVTSD